MRALQHLNNDQNPAQPHTDDHDDLHQSGDQTTERDLSIPRPLDGPVKLAPDSGRDIVGVSQLSASADLPPSTDDLDLAKIIAAPIDPQDRPAWRSALITWRQQAATRAGAAAIDGPAPQVWAARCRTVFLAWLWDCRLYDFQRDEFTPDQLLTDLDHQFGGIDGIVLWHAYPVIGLDERNQFDFYDVPGLAELVTWFKSHNIRVFLNYNPWDTASQQRPGTDADELRQALEGLDADGLFLDTLREGDLDLIGAVGTDRVLESESRISITAMRTHQLSWAQWFADSPTPGVLRAHWLDRHHMQHHTRRWNRDHSEELQSAYLNGCGVLLWDNVFGTWVGWNARDRATHRRMRAVQTQYSDLLISGSWNPLFDVGASAEIAGVYCSRFSDADHELYLLVNRSDTEVTVGLDISGDGVWTDLFPGETELCTGGGPLVTLPARGISALVRASAAVATIPAPPSADTTFPAQPLVRLPPPRIVPRLDVKHVQMGDRRPVGQPAAAISAGVHRSAQRFRRRETGMLTGAWWVDAWKPLAPDLHAEMEQDCTTTVACGVRIRTAPITRGEFADFLRESGYRPAITHRFLAGAQTRMPNTVPETPDEQGLPVTYVDLVDAQTYAAWVGGRLPTAAEWHLAAAVSSYNSPVWQWTADHYREGPTRFDLLVGANPEAQTGSGWYFDTGPQPAGWVAKLLETGRGLSRSGTLGFGLAWGPESVTALGAERIVAPGRPIQY